MSKELAVRDVIQSVEKDWNAVENLRLSFAKEMGFALQIVEGNASLKAMAMKEPAQLRQAIYNVALTGLSLNPVLKHGYILPRKGKLIFEPSYMGMTEILIQAGTIIQMQSSVVCAGDLIDIQMGDTQSITHRINMTAARGDVIGAYAIATLPTGQKQYEVMTRDEIDSIRKRSQGGQAWESDFSEMARKTVVRRIFKHLPKTALSDAAENAFKVFDENNEIDYKSEPVNPVTGEIRAARLELEASKEPEAPKPDTLTEKSKRKILTLKTVDEFNLSFEKMGKIQDLEMQAELIAEIKRVAETKGFLFDADSDGFYEQVDEEIKPAPETKPAAAPETPQVANDSDLF